MGFFAVILLFFVMAQIALTVFSYFAESVYIMGVRKKAGEKMPGLVWIPVYGQYLYGRIAGSRAGGILLALNHIAVIGMFFLLTALDEDVLIFQTMLVLIMLGYAVKLFLSYKLFRSAVPGKCVLLTVLSVLSCGWLRPLMLLVFHWKSKAAKGKINKKEDLFL